MGAFLAVIFANDWMKSFEGVNKGENDGMKQIRNNHSKNVQNVQNFVWNSKGIEYEKFEFCFILSVRTSVTTNTEKWVI